MEIIHIKWHGPYNVYQLVRVDAASNPGIYVISRVFGGNETLLYIGKTSRCFLKRITEHNKEWFKNVRGELRIRLGILNFETGKRYSERKLDDVESLLIHWHAPRENTMKVGCYTGKDGLTIINHGRRGLLDRVITTDDLEWVK